MPNERGFLPKARREDLDENLSRKLDRWFTNAYEDDNLFLTIARRPGLLEAIWGFIRYTYGGGSTIEPELFELVRMKLAWNNQCLHCSSVKLSSAVDSGASDELFAKLFDYESSDLPERTKAALRLGDRLSGDHLSFGEADYRDLRSHFTDEEILDLGMCIAFFSGWQRFNQAFGIMPDHWQDGSQLPWEAMMPHRNVAGDELAGATAST